jgi:hypothetical protein
MTYRIMRESRRESDKRPGCAKLKRSILPAGQPVREDARTAREIPHRLNLIPLQ